MGIFLFPSNYKSHLHPIPTDLLLLLTWTENGHKPPIQTITFTDLFVHFLSFNSHILFNKSIITNSSFRVQSYFIWTKFAAHTEILDMHFQPAQSQAFGNYSQKFGNSYWRHGPCLQYFYFMWYVRKTNTQEQLLRIFVHSVRSKHSIVCCRSLLKKIISNS